MIKMSKGLSKQKRRYNTNKKKRNNSHKISHLKKSVKPITSHNKIKKNNITKMMRTPTKEEDIKETMTIIHIIRTNSISMSQNNIIRKKNLKNQIDQIGMNQDPIMMKRKEKRELTNTPAKTPKG